MNHLPVNAIALTAVVMLMSADIHARTTVGSGSFNESTSVSWLDDNDQGHIKDYSYLSSWVAGLLNDAYKKTRERYYATENFYYTDRGLLDVSLALKAIAERNDINDVAIEVLLEYIGFHNSRVYSDSSYWQSDATSEALYEAVIALSNMSGFYDNTPRTARIHADIARAISSQIDEKHHFRKQYRQLLPLVHRVLGHYQWNSSWIAQEPEFETATIYWLQVLYYSYGAYGDKEHVEYLSRNLQSTLNVLKSLAKQDLVIWKNKWGDESIRVYENLMGVLSHMYGIMEHYYYLTPDLPKRMLSDQIDPTVVDIARQLNLRANNHAISPNLLTKMRLQISANFAKGTRRDSKELCDKGQFKPYCDSFEEADFFDSMVTCPGYSKVKIKAARGLLNDSRRASLCQTLKDTEDRFHRTMQTNPYSAVYNDWNDTIEVIISKDRDQWQTYGYALFDAITDNGGVYLEGNPSKKDNQARLFVYQKKDYDGHDIVWNLAHEYTHYLDGRYNKFGDFHAHSNIDTVWWAEGLAEYVAYGKCNPHPRKKLYLHEIVNPPSLKKIFNASYNGDFKTIYTWSYLAHLYFYDTHQENHMLRLASALRSHDVQYGENDYRYMIRYLSDNYDRQFQDWVKDDYLAWLQSKDGYRTECRN